MENDLILKKLKSHNRKEQLKKLFIVLGILAALFTICMLRLSAESQEAAVYCGYESEHTDACYEERQVLICGLEENAEHQHSDVCYITDKVLICDKSVHQHTLQCFSDPEADVEDSSVWERSADIELSGDIRDDLAAAAATQIGYTESERNYKVLDDGVTKNGYTRYGDKYGDRYGDWSVMFCAFCMDCAKVDTDAVPMDSSCEYWIEELKDSGLFESADNIPDKGDIVFLEDDHCGIVTGADEESIKVIEGDRDDQVRRTIYERTDPVIKGYGVLIRGKADQEAAEQEENEAAKGPDGSGNNEAAEGTDGSGSTEAAKGPDGSGNTEAAKETDGTENTEELMAAEEKEIPENEGGIEEAPAAADAAEGSEAAPEGSAASAEEQAGKPALKGMAPARLQSGPDQNDATSSSDLADFVTSYTIKDYNGDIIGEDGTVYLGEKYRISLDFAENNESGQEKQFKYNDDGYLTYQFDRSVFFFDGEAEGPILNSDNVEVGTYHIDENGLATVRFFYVDADDNIIRQPTGPEDKNIIDRYSNVSFDLFVTATVMASDSEDQIEIDLGNDVIIHVDVNNGGTLYNKKAGTAYNDALRTVEYVVEVGCSHGSVHDLQIEDTAVLTIDNIVYPAGSMHVQDMTITDLNGDPVYNDDDELVDTIEKLNALNADLIGGQGYLIRYKVKLDDRVVTDNNHSNGTIENTLTSQGTTGEGPVSPGPVTTTTRIKMDKLSKSAYPVEIELEGGGTKRLIKWTISAGNYVDDIGGEVLTDTLGDGLRFYTGLPVEYSIQAPESSRTNGTLSWNTSGDQGAVIHSDDAHKADFHLPGSGTRYSIVYYTDYSNGDSTYENSVGFDGSGSYQTETSQITMTGQGTTVNKSHYNEDNEYIYYRIEAFIPGGPYSSGFYISDLLNCQNASRNIENLPEQMHVILEDPGDGTQKELLPYGTGENQSDIEGEYYYLMTSKTTGSNQVQLFYIVFGNVGNGAERYYSNGTWPFATDKKVIVTYAAPKSSKDQRTHQSITEVMNGGTAIDNTSTVYVNRQQAAQSKDSLLHVADIAKNGKVTNNDSGTIHYKVGVPNTQIVDGEYQSVLQASYHDHFIRDSFDERLEYVPGTMKANVYARPTSSGNLYSITNDSTIYLTRYAVYTYNGTIVDQAGELTAYMRDFRRTSSSSYNGDDLSGYNDLEQLLRRYPDAFAVVIEYDMKVRDEYMDISEAQKEFALSNEVRLGYVKDDGNYLSDPADTTVEYTNKVIDKTTGDLKNDDTLDFEILINTQGRDLTDQESVVVEDTMCSALVLYLNTISVETGSGTGSAITWTPLEDPSVIYNRAENKLSIRIPDNVPVRIKYTCKVSGEQGEQVSVSNTAGIRGYSNCARTYDAEYSVNGSSGGSADFSSSEIYVLKQSAETHVPLSGASFALYGPENPSRMGTPPEGVSQTVTAHGETLYYYTEYTTETKSGALNGSFTVTSEMLSEKGHYAFVETQAPEGYIIDDGVRDFYAFKRPINSIEGVQLLEDRFTLTIEDQPELQGYRLPDTGGAGSAGYYVSGALLAACAMAGLLIRIRRRGPGRSQ